MGERFLDWLLAGMKRLQGVLSGFWRWRTAPPRPGHNETCTDQW